MRNWILSGVMGIVLSPVAVFSVPTINVILGEQMRINQALSPVTANGTEWNITLRMQDDNENPSLGSAFRRWWHVELANLNPAGETMNFTITNSGYTDFIVPVWSRDGGATYERIPTGSNFDDQFHFSLTTTGITSFRLAKWYPVTLPQYAAFRATFNTNPMVTETMIGQSEQGRDMYMYTITDSSIPNMAKQRVWIHTAVHCAENTAYYSAEGLINWLLGGSPEANAALDGLIYNIVPMANPDGVALGNYRTTSSSVNLELQWGTPYNSTVPEIVNMRTQVENFMGTAASPGANPIKVLLNLHSSHGVDYPFHFVHQANWPTNGVTPSVRALELNWVNKFRDRSPYLDLGDNQSSTLSGRGYVESMMHDRYSIQPQWDDVMAITMEGGYQEGPGSAACTPDDFRQLGLEMGLALNDYFGIVPPTQLEEWNIF